MADARKELRSVMISLYLMILVGIAGIGLAVYGVKVGVFDGGVAFLVIGVLLAFFGFIFGIPLIWLRNSERRKTLRIAVTVLDNERTTLTILAGSVGCSDAEARDKVVWALNHGYLPGYVINGNEVLLSKFLDPNLQEHAVECPNCGASFTYVGKIGQCPYCGDYYPPQNKKV